MSRLAGLKEQLPRLGGAAVLVLAGVVIDRVAFPVALDEQQLAAIARAVMAPVQETPSGDQEGAIAAIKAMNDSWPGHLDWVVRHSDEARTLFTANGDRPCPLGELLQGVPRCVFVAPLKPTTIRKPMSLPAIGGR
jgi:hypothetical protein